MLLTKTYKGRMGELLFDDIFRVERVNPDGKKFDKGMLMECWCLFTRQCFSSWVSLFIAFAVCLDTTRMPFSLLLVSKRWC